MTEQYIDSKYQILRQLGQGGMGAVYEARHLGTGRRVAVKVIISQALNAAGPEVIRRFQREARASGAIESEHVVQVLDTGIDPLSQNPYMVMELLNGEDVQQLLQRTGPITPDAALRVLSQACIGLRKAHEAGIVHRDIKSANLFLSRRDTGDILVKILDFGIAKVRADQFSASGDHALTRTGSMLGSPLYMSPEQAKGAKHIDHRSDIWSLGVVLYEALAGLPPNSQCDTIGELILAICSAPPRPIQDAAPWVPPEIAQIVHKALAQDAAARFQSAAEMHAAIMALLPQGAGLGESMLTPMPEPMRAFVAPRFVQTGPSGDRLSVQSALAASVVSGPNVALSSSGAGTTTAGFGATQGMPAGVPRRSPLRWIAPVAAIGVVAAVGVGYVALHGSSHAADAVASASASMDPAAPPPAVPPPAPVATATVRTVSVEIAPGDAKASVDGADAAAHDGKIDVSGEIGSVHHVRLARGSRTTTVDVVIAETGPVPSRVALSEPVAAVHHPGALAQPVVAATTAHVATPPPPPTHAPATPKPNKGTPSVDRSFQ